MLQCRVIEHATAPHDFLKLARLFRRGLEFVFVSPYAGSSQAWLLFVLMPLGILA